MSQLGERPSYARDAFERFRTAYPRILPHEIVPAWEVFRAAVASGADAERIIAAAAAYATKVGRVGIEIRVAPPPARWLREKRWEPAEAPQPTSPLDWTPEQVRQFQESYLALARELSAGAEASRAAFRDEILDAVRREFSSGGGRPGSPAEEPTVRAALRALGRTLRSALRRAFRSGDRSASEPRPA